MLFWIYTLTLIVSAALFSWVGSHLVRSCLQGVRMLDEPNERSNHTIPTPRGGGIAVMGAALALLMIAGAPPAILYSALLLAVIGFLDDKNGLAVGWRLLAQIAAVGLLFIPDYGVLGNGLLIFTGMVPPLLDGFLAALLLLAFLNIFNFMDGIDGISAVEGMSIGIGLLALSLIVPGLKMLGIDGIIIAASLAGFLALNWHPARLFLGDTGSVPLGFLLGVLLLLLAGKGYGAAALILPAYYLTDGGLTLLRRLLNRERIWEAHSKHAYQIAVRTGQSHSAVSLTIAKLNYALILLASFSVAFPSLSLYPLLAAYAASFGVYFSFQKTHLSPLTTYNS